MMKTTKTEAEILKEIHTRGSSTIEHGIYRHKTYGTRRVNARNSLIKKGLVKIDVRGEESEGNHGYTAYSYWSRIISA
jgi:hypothetical protein